MLMEIVSVISGDSLVGRLLLILDETGIESGFSNLWRFSGGATPLTTPIVAKGAVSVISGDSLVGRLTDSVTVRHTHFVSVISGDSLVGRPLEDVTCARCLKVSVISGDSLVGRLPRNEQPYQTCLAFQ